MTWSPNVAVSNSFNPFEGYPNQNKIGDYITIVSDNTGGNVAYSATFNFNPNRGQHEEDVYYVRVFPWRARRHTDANTQQRHRLQHPHADSDSYIHAYSNTNCYTDRNSYTDCYGNSHSYSTANSHAKDWTDAESDVRLRGRGRDESSDQ